MNDQMKLHYYAIIFAFISPRSLLQKEEISGILYSVATVKERNKHRCINFYINKFQIPSPTLRGVAKRPLILADMTFLTRLRSSEIPPLIVLAA